MKKVLVACEESQRVTIELRRLPNIEAFSCDLLPASGGHPEWHLQQDVTTLLSQPWDMILAFPPCTHLATSGARWFKEKQQDGRQQQGIDFFMLFTELDCPKVAIENPVGIMSTVYCKPDQIIEPYQFGDPEKKRTCLWLKGLPLLTPTNIVTPKIYGYFKSGKKKGLPIYGNMTFSPSPDRGMLRSKTYPGIAKAIALQWGTLL